MRGEHTGPPRVVLGRSRPDGIAQAIYALTQIGVRRKPVLAASIRGRILVKFTDGNTSARMIFEGDRIVVADGGMRRHDVVVSGRMPAIVNLTMAPNWRGLPKLSDRRGRAVIGHLAAGRITFRGNQALARSVLTLLTPADE